MCFMAASHIVFNCPLAMLWEGSWRYLTPFQFGLPVLVYTAELHSGWDLWGLWAWCCPLFSGGPQGAPTPPWTTGYRHVLPSDSAWWPAGRSFVSSEPSGLRLLDNGAASTLRGVGLPQYHQQGGTARGKNEDEVDVSCIRVLTGGPFQRTQEGKSSMWKMVGF